MQGCKDELAWWQHSQEANVQEDDNDAYLLEVPASESC